MRYTTAIIAIVVASYCCIDCHGEENIVNQVQKYGQTNESKATDVVLHRHKRGWFSVIAYGSSFLLRAGALGYTLAQAITGGCAGFPSICRDKDAIENLDRQIQNMRKEYDRKYLENKKAYLALTTANTENAYIMYYINETIQAVQSIDDYQNNTAAALEIEMNELYKRFKANPNATVYLASLIGELEYSLSNIREMIESQKMGQIKGLLIQYLIEFSVSKFVKSYSRAYHQIISASTEDIFGTSVWTAMFSADASEVGIVLDPNHPRYDEVMAKYGASDSSKVTVKQKFKYAPKVFHQMWINAKTKWNNLGTSIKKWKRIKNLKGFKGKLMHSLRGPREKLNKVRQFFVSKPSRKYYVKNYKLSWSRGGMVALGILGDAIQIAVDSQHWKDVADKMGEARKEYENYLKKLRKEVQQITQQAREIDNQWPEIINNFKSISLSFKSIIDQETKYEEFNDVLGLPKLPVDLSSPLFSVDFNRITKHNIEAAQANVKAFMQKVDNDVARIADEMQARVILYENVLKMTADEQTVKEMLDDSHNIYKFSSSETVKNFGKALSKKDIVCTVSTLRITKNEYDYFQLQPFRPRCDVSRSTFWGYERQAERLRREEKMTSIVSRYKGNSLSTLLDLVHAAYRTSTDDNMRKFGNTITEQVVICSVSKVFPKLQKFDFISLSPFRPKCSSVTAKEFQKMNAEAETVRKTSAAVENTLSTCEQYQFCPCPALMAKTNGISELDVIELIKTLRPNLSQYCGTVPLNGCKCVVF